jgi:hypothetical protein
MLKAIAVYGILKERLRCPGYLTGYQYIMMGRVACFNELMLLTGHYHHWTDTRVLRCACHVSSVLARWLDHPRP